MLALLCRTNTLYTLTNGEVLLLCSTAFSNLAMIIGSDSKRQDWGLYSLNEGFLCADIVSNNEEA